MQTSPRYGMFIVWLERTRFGCVSLVFVFVILSVIRSCATKGPGFATGYFISGVLFYCGAVFVLWTVFILILKFIIVRFVPIPDEPYSSEFESTEGSEISAEDPLNQDES